ncbi:MAG: ACP S-malonyltransferase [Gammaproteobacteria bacterium]
MPFAAVFPGQGSQSVGMLAGLAAEYEEVARTLAEAAEALGYDLPGLIAEGPAAELDRTENTQPALLAVGVAAWRCWLAQGGARPTVMAGHSLGEYTALVAAGALDFADGLRLVKLRGELMQQAVPAGTGAMSAILGLDTKTVTELCAADNGVVAPANLNSPEQVVIAGERKAVERVSESAREAGAKRVISLAVSVPSHCVLMQPAAQGLAAALAEVTIKSPELPVLNNVDVAVPNATAAVRDALVRQLTHPVRWTDIVTAFVHDYGVAAVVEFGPGKVLAGLVRRIDRSLAALPVFDPASLKEALAVLAPSA